MMSWREREARNEARFRDQNEWIETASERFGAVPLTSFVCECGDAGCTQTIELTRAEYEEVRSASTHFAVVPNHENPESEQVVSEGARFSVIDKIEGWSLRIARETDVRASSSGRAGRPS
jgi:hypothetical protein